MTELDATSQRSPRSNRFLVGTGLVAVAIAAAAIAVFIFVEARSPQAVAERYLEYVATGDATAANALVAPVHPELAGVRDDRLLTDGVLQAAIERIGEVRVAQTSADGVNASFDVAFTLAGEQFETRLDLVAQGDSWQVAAPLTARFLIEAAGPAALSIAGVPIPPPRLGEVTWVTMYPAVYPVEVVDSDQYKTSVDRIVVGIDSSPEVQVVPAA